MPSGMAVDCRELVETLRGRSDLVPKKSVGGSTGFVNVIKVGEWYQARLQIPGDVRGGEKKRKQHSLPGIFKDAEDAALYLAFITGSRHGQGQPAFSKRVRTGGSWGPAWCAQTKV